MTMTPDTTAQARIASGDALGDIRRRLVRVHAALAERTNQEVAEIMPWTLAELMEMIRDIRAIQLDQKSAS